MKIYISADIEGVTGTTVWDETRLGSKDYIQFAEQMTREVVAACEGAIDMGADEIVIRDGHGSARNIDYNKIPKCSKIIRGWMNTPYSMMEGLDGTFDAAMFIGYHSGSGYSGNPLSHTMNGKNNYVKINGEIESEFVMNSYVAAYFGVPVVFLSGDKELCQVAKKFNKAIRTVGVKEGVGGATINLNPEYACQLIKDGVKEALVNIQNCKIDLPQRFEVEINFKEHFYAKRASYFPGVSHVDSHSVKYMSASIKEMMTTRMFIL